jgi:penicillin-binding protein 2
MKNKATTEGTEYIGKLGIEQSFEMQLHGVTGVDQRGNFGRGRAVRKLATAPRPRPATPSCCPSTSNCSD